MMADPDTGLEGSYHAILLSTSNVSQKYHATRMIKSDILSLLQGLKADMAKEFAEGVREHISAGLEG